MSLHFCCGLVGGCRFLCRRDSQKPVKYWQLVNCAVSGLAVIVINCLQTQRTLGREACLSSFEVLCLGGIRCGHMQIFCKKSINCFFRRTLVTSLFPQETFSLDLAAKSERGTNKKEGGISLQVRAWYTHVNSLSEHI